MLELSGVNITELQFRFVCKEHKVFLNTSEDGWNSDNNFAAVTQQGTEADSPNFTFTLDDLYCPENTETWPLSSGCGEHWQVVIAEPHDDWKKEDI